ncbi:type II toxin-antitoxin system RelE/ParE family toxin [Enterococcus faecium]|nr:type II toxin-antitoxin system RelE/ParE family toxin [Enterococcus faecium]
MRYHVETTKNFDKQIKKMDKFVAKNILKWLFKHIENSEDPKVFGKELLGNYAGKWRYRIGDYRVICKIDNDKLIVLALEVGHRRKIYKK